MPKIAIPVTTAVDNVRTIAGLRRALSGASIAELQRRLAGGSAIVESLLFENDFQDVAAQLRAVIDELAEVDAEFRVFELEPDETYDPAADEHPRLDASNGACG